ncbi:MAG TPA: EexN family lipoprotein, partial [Gammaproteobacteria bacterium]|nr:EexN family lipoprotein [Gammaproteobacteria bacterium]
MIWNFQSARRGCGSCFAAALLCLVTACEEPQPITFAEFMEDDIARDGTLARCNEDRAATMDDFECANARRAASAIALREERARRAAYEVESERRLAALREEVERERAAAREAQQRAEAAARAAYEAQWERRSGAAVGLDGEPLFPQPAGPQPPGTAAPS